MDQPKQAVALGTGADVGLGDRVVPAEHQRDRPGVDRVADDALDRCVRGDRIGRDHRRIAEVHHPERLERIDPGVEVHPAEAVACDPDCQRTEARARKARDKLVQGRADNGHIDPVEVVHRLCVGTGPERLQAAVVGAPVRFPALVRVDRRHRVPGCPIEAA